MSNASDSFGLLAEFVEPDALVEATARIQEAGYRDYEAYSPMPVEGLSEAVGKVLPSRGDEAGVAQHTEGRRAGAVGTLLADGNRAKLGYRFRELGPKPWGAVGELRRAVGQAAVPDQGAQ